MKTLYFDSINPFTGEPFAFDDPNLFWVDPAYYLEPGDPGFVPYPGMPPDKPAKKKKPFRRQAKSETPNHIHTPTMATSFEFNVAPNPNGGFTTRAALCGMVEDAAFFTRAAALSPGLTEEQVRSALVAVLDTILETAATGGFSQGLLGRLRYRPTSGGSQAAPDAFNNAEEINADVALSFTAAARDAWRSTLSLHSLGEVGKVSPVIDSILSQENGAASRYAPGTMIELNGDNLRFDKADLTQGVFFRSGNDPEVRATVYGTMSPSSISVLVPGTLSGPLTVRVSAFINGSVRSFTYMDPITPL